MIRKRYSRLASVEEKKNIRNAYLYLILSVVAIVIFIFFGIPMLVRFAGFVGEIAKSGKPVEINDITPPAPPFFEEIPEFTNSDTLSVSGKSESGAIIKIRANNKITEIITNNEGEFNYTMNLVKGENSIDAIAVDSSGNESNQSNTYRVTFDNEKPEIKIDSPVDGASYYGPSARQLSIKGNVSEKVNLTINERIVQIRDDNNFTFATTLSEGENKFEIKAIDPAGNETLTSLTVTFNP